MRAIYAIDSVTLDGERLFDVLSLSVWADGGRSSYTGDLIRTQDRVFRLTGNWRVESEPLRLVSPQDRLVVQFRKEVAL